MDAAYSKLGRTTTSLVSEKTKFLRRKPSVLVALEEFSLNVLTPIHIIRDGYTKVFC